MGIQGLLPFLANSTRDACISEFENQFVAVDAYCWLHKGIYSCAFDLAMNKPNTKYVTYCMRYIEMLCHYNVKPILVFDGRQLSSKGETEKKRREDRKRKFERGKELLRLGNIIEGKKLLGESVDVTHELAVNLIKECHKKNIDCIVAPYEADAQLAFFSIQNVVKCIITEDSDLLAYGCERVMFKMDTSGYGKLVEKNNIHFSLSMTPDEVTENSFRYLCILSGCDYLPSLKSIGPANALKFIKIIKNKNIYDVLPKLPIYLNKEKLHITSNYLEGFKIAEKTFQHQLVYDPFQRMQIPLKPVKNDDDIVGEKLPEDEAFQLAIGNIDPMTMKKVYDFNPDKFGRGFNILWRTELLPNASPKKNTFGTKRTSTETKKRQREGLESDSVSLVTNNLKKPCVPLCTTNVKISVAKDSEGVRANGFIFQSKVLSEKKDNLKQDVSELLRSRYFIKGKFKKSNHERRVSSTDVNIRRKDETDEEYSRRLLEENFLTHENDKSCNCCASSQLENHCSSCSKCPQCCRCIFTAAPEIRDSDEREPGNRKTVESQHSLLDEIYKNEKESKKKMPYQSSPIQNSQYCKLLSTIVCEKETLSYEKKNEEVENVFETVERSPSPVFILQKTNSGSKTKIPDTASTPTSVYFPSRKTPQVLHGISSTSQRKLNFRASDSLTSKTWRNSVKNSLAHKTLFDFGFKKES